MDEPRCLHCNRVLEDVPKYCSIACRSKATNYRRTAILNRLREGPASAEDLARAVWGDEHARPYQWQGCITSAIHELRKSMSITTRPAVYEIDDPTAAENIRRSMS